MITTQAPTAILSNGVGVANFSSPHPFNFTDGTVLDRCDSERVAAGLSLSGRNLRHFLTEILEGFFVLFTQVLANGQ